jgi:hypothetical protein
LDSSKGVSAALSLFTSSCICVADLDLIIVSHRSDDVRMTKPVIRQRDGATGVLMLGGKMSQTASGPVGA